MEKLCTEKKLEKQNTSTETVILLDEKISTKLKRGDENFEENTKP